MKGARDRRRLLRQPLQPLPRRARGAAPDLGPGHPPARARARARGGDPPKGALLCLCVQDDRFEDVPSQVEGEEEEMQEDETIENFEDRVLNKRAAQLHRSV